MVAPLILLGALGAAGATALAPHIENRASDIRARGDARRNQRVFGDLLADPGAGPMDFARAGLSGGLLGVEDLIGTAQAGRQLDISQQNANTASGQLGLARDRFGFDQQQATLSNMLQLDQLVQTPTGPVDMSIALPGLIDFESGGNPAAVSHKGAMGLGQIMPDNIVPWARREFPQLEAFSDEMILSRYAEDPQFQADLAGAAFGRYVREHGLRDAFVKWHAGPAHDWQDIVADYEQAQRTGRPGRYHDGNMHTFDYVRKNLDAYQRRLGMAQSAAQRDQVIRLADQVGTPQQRELARTAPEGSTLLNDLLGDLTDQATPSAVAERAAPAELQQQASELQDRAKAALPLVEDIKFTRGGGDFEQVQARLEVIDILTRGRMDYLRRQLELKGELSDQDMKMADQLFPQIEVGLFANLTGTQRRSVRAALRRLAGGADSLDELEGEGEAD